MTKPTLAAAAALCLLAVAAPARAALKIGQAWSLAPPAGAPVADGYLTIANTGKTADRLLGVTTPWADHVGIHQMSMQGAIMRMRPVPEGVAIPPGQTVTFAPDGYHLMLVGPKRRFAAGERIPCLLRFEHAGTVAVDFQVLTAPPAGARAAMDRR